MGKATITGGGTDGLYTVNLDFGDAERDALVTDLQARKTDIEAAISTLDTTITGYESTEGSLITALDSAITTWNASNKTDADKALLVEASDNLIAHRTLMQSANNERSALQLELAKVDDRITKLNALVVTESRSMWCADYTQSGTGEVATIEVNGTPSSILIAPGAPGASDVHGYMQSTAVMSSSQCIYNLAILPGWEKWLPTYRAGTLTAVDTVANTCSVDLDAVLSSQQGLNVNQASSLTGVPVVYMACHASVFSVDDRVIVKFNGQDWDDPTVIGFESNPVACVAERIYVTCKIDWDNRAYTPGGEYDFDNLHIIGTFENATITDTSPAYCNNIHIEDWNGVWVDGETNYAKYLPVPIGQTNVLIDFDDAWTQDTGTSDEYTQVVGGLTEQTYGSSISLAPIVAAGDTITPGVAIRHYIYEWTVGGDVTIGEFDYHTAAFKETLDAYDMTENVEGPVPHDRDHANAWILARYAAPPTTIYIDIDSEWIEYTFESIGPRPDYFDNWGVTPAPVDTWGVIYRKA